MSDQPSHRATRRNLATQPIPRGKPHPKNIRGNITLSPDELALALEFARADRLEQQLRGYAWKKRTA